MPRGRLLTIEGLDGAGKTTLAGGLAEALSRRGIEVSVLREPGSVNVAERLRALVTEPGLAIGARAEALVYAAARAQLVEEALNPLLHAGSWVVLDRFVDSSLAYQGAGRTLGIEPVRSINEFATSGLSPDRTLILTIDPPVGRRRSRARANPLDRLEREDDAFFERIARAYAELAAAEPERIRTIDASQGPDQVLEAAMAAIRDLL